MAKKKVVVKVVPRKKKTAKKESEVTRLGYALRAMGALGGGKVGAYLGNPMAGAATGTSLGAALSRWLGAGDYSIKSNSLVRQSPDGTIPAMHNNNQSIVVRHKEFVSEILSSTSFSVQRQLIINPGQSVTFPWLSGIASQFEEYAIRGMVYHYVPTSGTAINSTNPALGSVMLQTSYRANSAAPESKMEMMNEYWASESVPSDSFCHPIECNPKENPFNIHYVRTGAVPAGDSPLLYDYGKTFLAVTGNPADGNILGELWISYEIELRKPVLTNINDLDVTAYSMTTNSGLDNNHMFGTSQTVIGNTMAGAVSFTNGAASGSIIIGPGNIGSFLVTYWLTGGSLNTTTFFNMSGAGSTVQTVFNGSPSINYNGTSVSSGANLVVVNITNPSTTTSLNFTNSAFTATRIGVTISPFNPTIP